jgi:uncharacterized membrane protein
MLWSGTAASFVDLHPAGFTSSSAVDISGLSQVGYGSNATAGDSNHALLWNGTADNMIDLHPAGFTESRAEGVFGPSQVGSGSGPGTGNNSHALLWNGTASSVVDLHLFLNDLGPKFTSSFATGISDNGLIVGTAENEDGAYAVLWTPIPEPSTGVLIGCAVISIGSALRHNYQRRQQQHRKIS